jgi:hypothetical protein
MHRQSDTQSSDAAPSNEDRSTIHGPARISATPAIAGNVPVQHDEGSRLIPSAIFHHMREQAASAVEEDLRQSSCTK